MRSAGPAGPTARVRAAGAALVLALLGALVAGCGAAPVRQGSPGVPTPAGAGAQHVTVARLAQVDTDVVVDARGFALYMFVPDHRRGVTCFADCASAWPPLWIGSGHRPSAGPGVDRRLLGVDDDPTGGRVVTYNGWPLYYFAPDVTPLVANGQAVDINGGFWFLMRPDGRPLVPADERGVLAGV